MESPRSEPGTLRLLPIAAISTQPIPIRASVITTPDRLWTSIARKWRPGDPRHCGLCPPGTCVADGDSCHMVVPGVVSPAAAPLYSTLGLPREVGGAIGRD